MENQTSLELSEEEGEAYLKLLEAEQDLVEYKSEATYALGDHGEILDHHEVETYIFGFPKSPSDPSESFSSRKDEGLGTVTYRNERVLREQEDYANLTIVRKENGAYTTKLVHR